MTTPAAAELQRAEEEAHRLAHENQVAARELGAALQERDALQRKLEAAIKQLRDATRQVEALGASQRTVLNARDKAMERVLEMMHDRDDGAMGRNAAVEARDASVRQAASLMRGRDVAVIERDKAVKRLKTVEQAAEEKYDAIGALNREVQWLRDEAGLARPSR